MPKPTLTSRIRDFDDFLYAVVREEAGGPALTVLSLLARQNVDPWETARRLARLPQHAAVAQLRPLIAAQGKDQLTPHDDTVALALLKRLPRSSMWRWSATPLSRKSMSGTRTRIKIFIDSLWSNQGRRPRSDENEEP